MSWVIEGKLHAFDGAGVVFMPQCSRGCQALHEIQKEEGKAAASWRAATALVHVAGAFQSMTFVSGH